MPQQSLAERARGSHIRITPQRELVCDVLEQSCDHPNAEEIYGRAKEQYPAIAVATVYRTLRVLEDAGLVARREFGGRKGRFELFRDHHHDHIVDAQSGEITEFHNEQLTILIEKVARSMGYVVEHHRLEIYARKSSGGPRSL